MKLLSRRSKRVRSSRLGVQARENQMATSLRVHYVPLRSRLSSRFQGKGQQPQRRCLSTVCLFVCPSTINAIIPFHRFPAPADRPGGRSAFYQEGIFYGSFEGNPAMTSRLWEFAGPTGQPASQPDQSLGPLFLFVRSFASPALSPEGLSERKQCLPNLVFQQNGQTSIGGGGRSGNAEDA